MLLPLKRFRGWSKPPGVPRIDWALAPRGLKLCAPLADPAWITETQRIATFPSAKGSNAKFAASAAGAGVAFSGSGAANCVGYVTDNPASNLLTFEVLFVTGSSLVTQAVCGFNSNADGTGSGNNNLFFNSSGQLAATLFDGNARTATDITTSYATGTLYHAVVVNGGPVAGQVLYVNGVQVATSLNGGGFTDAFFCLGSHGITNGIGNINSNVTILLANYANVAWTAEEVAQRALDPFNFLLYPEDDLFAVLVGAVGGRIFNQSCLAVNAAIASLNRKTTKPLQASDAAVATLTSLKVHLQSAQASNSAVASLTRQTGKVAQATNAAAASSKHQIGKTIQAANAAVASLTKRTSKGLSATNSAVASIARGFTRSFQASCAAVASCIAGIASSIRGVRITNETLSGPTIGNETLTSGPTIANETLE